MSDRDEFGRYEGDDDERREAYGARRKRHRAGCLCGYPDWPGQCRTRHIGRVGVAALGVAIVLFAIGEQARSQGFDTGTGSGGVGEQYRSTDRRCFVSLGESGIRRQRIIIDRNDTKISHILCRGLAGIASRIGHFYQISFAKVSDAINLAIMHLTIPGRKTQLSQQCWATIVVVALLAAF